ncbi:MAG: general stress protein [Candidatus Caenarcaniphilales bacterium]|nr:general stress protein [Candidatus Caenarcaniphilales bacterium]
MGTEINGATGNSLTEIRERHTNAAKESQPTGIHTSGNYWENKKKNYTEEQTSATTDKLQETVEKIEAKNIFQTDENENGFLSTNIQVLADDEDAIKDVRTLFETGINYITDQKSGVRATILNPKSKEENELATKVNTIALAMWEVQNPDNDPLISAAKKDATSYLKTLLPGYFDNPAIDAREVKSVIAMLSAKNDEEEMMGALKLMGAVDSSDIDSKSLKVTEAEDGSTSVRATSSTNLWGRMFKKLGKNPLANMIVSNTKAKLEKIASGAFNKEQLDILSKNNALRNNFDRIQKVFIREAAKDSQKMVVKATSDDIDNTLTKDFDTISSNFGLGVSVAGLKGLASKAMQSLMKAIRPNGVEENMKRTFEGSDSYFSTVNEISLKRAKVDNALDALKSLEITLNKFDPGSKNPVFKQVPLTVIGKSGADGKLLTRDLLAKVVSSRLKAVQGLLDPGQQITNVMEAVHNADSNLLATKVTAGNTLLTFNDLDSIYAALPKATKTPIQKTTAEDNIKEEITRQLKAGNDDIVLTGKLGTATIKNAKTYFQLDANRKLDTTSTAIFSGNHGQRELNDTSGPSPTPVNIELEYDVPGAGKHTFNTTFRGLTALERLNDKSTNLDYDVAGSTDFLEAVAEGAPSSINGLQGLLDAEKVGTLNFSQGGTFTDNQIDSILDSLKTADQDIQEVEFDPANSNDVKAVSNLTEKIIPTATSDLSQVSDGLTSIKKKMFSNIQKFATKHMKIANTSKAVVSEALIDRESGDLMLDSKIGNQLLKTSPFENLRNKARLASSQLKADDIENQGKLIAQNSKLAATNSNIGSTGSRPIVNLSGTAFVSGGNLRGTADIQAILKDVNDALEQYSSKNQSIATFLSLEKSTNGLLNEETYNSSNNFNNEKVKDARLDLLKSKLVELSHNIATDFAENPKDPIAVNIQGTLDREILGTRTSSIADFQYAGTGSESSYEQFTNAVSQTEDLFDVPEKDKSAQTSINKILTTMNISSLSGLNEEWQTEAKNALVKGFTELMQSTGLTEEAVKEIFTRNEELEGEMPTGFQGDFFNALRDAAMTGKLKKA